MDMLHKAILIFIFYFFTFNVNAQSDTIVPKSPDFVFVQLEYQDLQPDTTLDILAKDSVQKLVIFRFGNQIILRSELNDTLVFPILNSERFGDGDIFSDINNSLLIAADLIWLYPNKQHRLLQINWYYKINGMHVWTETDGIQIWDVTAQLCYLDCITREYIFSSGFSGTDSQTEVCELNIKIRNSEFTIPQNQCLKVPNSGTYYYTNWGYVKKR